MESNDRIQDPLLAPIHLVSKFTKREEIIEHMNAAINMHLKEKKNIILAYRSPELIGKRNSTNISSHARRKTNSSRIWHNR